MGFLFFLICLCILDPVHQTQSYSPTITDLTFKNMDFAMKLYRRISSYHDKNIFFSPLSISTTFATLLMGSDGDTQQEILIGLNLHQLGRVDEPELIPRLFQQLYVNITRNGLLSLDQGMGIFMSEQFNIEKTFEEQIKRFFNAEVRHVNFTDTKSSNSIINRFIRQKTRNRVTETVGDLDSLTQLLLINTIFFQGEWQKPFDPNNTAFGPFYIDNYNIVQVPMMFKHGLFYTMEDISLGVRGLKVPYREGVAMLILLPNQNMDYTLVDDEITASQFLSWVKELREIKLEVKIPKFDMQQSYSLHKILPDLGVRDVFHDSANLTRLSRNLGLKVSEVVHKAVIKVNEKGTTAAAATTVGIIGYSLPITFTINRPFFFFIYHEETNTLLFMGRVIDPTKM